MGRQKSLIARKSDLRFPRSGCCVRFGWIGLDICQTGPAEIAEHQVHMTLTTTTGISLISVLPQVNDQSIAAGRTMTFARHERGDRAVQRHF